MISSEPPSSKNASTGNEATIPAKTQSPPVFRQAYISRAKDEVSSEELDKLERLTSVRCQRLGICNLIVVNDGRVIQILEGKERVVRRILKRVIMDERHHLVKVFSEHADQKPLLKNSSLVIRHVDDVPDDMKRSLDQLMCDFQWTSKNVALTGAQVGFLRSLALFSFERPS